MTASMAKLPFTFTADLMPGASRDTLTRDRRALSAYAAANSVLLAFILSRSFFKSFPKLYSLTISQNPRRNLYAPMYSRIVSGIAALLHGTLNVTIRLFFGGSVALVIKLFASAKPKFKLEP